MRAASVHVLALRIDLRFPQAQSLKEKRSLLRPIVSGLRQRFEVSVAETDHQNAWQRCELGVAIVGGEAPVVEQVAADIDRFMWKAVGAEILSIDHTWLEAE